MNPLEVFNLYGWWQPEAWERYFYNEKTYDLPSNMAEFNAPFVNPWNLDLDTEEGRREFESKVNQLVADYPGYFVPEGESFNFNSYYAKRALKYGGDTTKFDANTLSSARAELENQLNSQETLGIAGGHQAEGKVGHSTLGTETSELIKPEKRRAFMN